MHRRTFLCRECGRTRRRIDAWKLRLGEPGWPHCCDAEMRILEHVEVEATSRLTPEARLAWLRSGSGLIRRRKHGNRKWTPAVTDKQTERGRERYVGSPRSRRKPTLAEEKAWALQGHRRKHARKKGEV
jgi:hypothetical protein